MHYYEFNIGDYRRDTSHLQPIEHYIYRALIDWYYLEESPIPKNNQWVLRRLSLGLEYEQNLVNVLSDFFYLDENVWRQRRIDAEIESYHSLLEKNRNNGKLGGRPKNADIQARKKPKITDRFCLGNPTETQVEPKKTLNQETNNDVTSNDVTINQEESKDSRAFALEIDGPEEPKRAKDAYSDKFKQFWSIYSKYKPVGKLAASKKFERVIKSTPFETIMDGLRSQETEFSRRDRQYVPNAATWLNQGRWEDEVIVKKSGPICEWDIEL